MSNPEDIDGIPDTPPPVPPSPQGPEADEQPTEVLEARGGEASGEQPTEVLEVAGAAAQPGGPDSSDPLIGTLLRGRWRVLERLGAGSFGTVYKVRDEKGGWIEALKILSVERLVGAEAESMRMRFLREAQIMKRLGNESPHIVGLSTYEEDIQAGLIYFLMEYVEGRVLSQILRAEGPLNPGRVIHMGLQVCDALITAHESEDPIVHRDLKLENLMITRDRAGREVVKVFDFGIAKLMEQDPDSRLTQSGTLGTPGYAAPEQLRAGKVDGRTDLFALGVVLYALLTGRDPWLGLPAAEPTTQTYELMAATDRGIFLPLEKYSLGIPPSLAEVVRRLLQRDPDARFRSARELRAALEEVGLVVGVDDGSGRLGDPLGGRVTSPGSAYGTGGSGLRSTSSGGGGGRRLAAVWFADLVGYSALSSTDEEAALALLETFHQTARQVIASGGGRLVQFIGDAAFAEFSSTERAVRTAMHFRRVFSEVTHDREPRPALRIGVHVGDVLIGSDGDLFGDGINVASRIQSEAEPGEILVSQDVWRQLKQRRDFGFVSMGERDLKGISAPVWLFSVDEAVVGSSAPTPLRVGQPQRPPRRLSRILPIAGVYAVASAVILLTVDLLVARLGLAAWVFPTAIVLLAIGLLVMLTTAWYQTRPTWERSVAEHPPWSLDVPDLIDHVAKRELPDPTWARAIMGGVVAFAVLFSAAGGYLAWQSPAAGVGADDAAAGVPGVGPTAGGSGADGRAAGGSPGQAGEAVGGGGEEGDVPSDQVVAADPDGLEDGRAAGPETPAEAPGEATGGAPAGGSPEGAVEPAGVEDPALRGDFDTALRAFEQRRASLDGSLHASLLPRLADLDADVVAARAAADEGRFTDALEAVVDAERSYDALLTESAALAAAQAAAAGAGGDRPADSGAVSAEGQPPGAGGVGGAPGPESTPAEVAAEALGELEAAIESEDIARVRDVWTSLSAEEDQGLRDLFASVRDLDVAYGVRSVERRGGRVVATVHTTYTFFAEQARRTVSTEIDQVFQLARRGGRWVVVESQTQG